MLTLVERKRKAAGATLLAMLAIAAPGFGSDTDHAKSGKPSATIENAEKIQGVLSQQITADVNDRIERARDLLNKGSYEEARELLRNGLNAVRGETGVPDTTRNALLSRLGAQIQATDRRADELELQQAEALRQRNTAEARARVVEAFSENQQTTSALMTRFDALMNQGQYNVLFTGGTGDISKAIAPFAEARLYAVQARAKDPGAAAPLAGMEMAMLIGSFSTELMNEELKEYRFLLSMNDVTRSSVPFPDTLTIEYPEADHWRMISEKRIKRYESVSLDTRDPKTQAIITALDKSVSMPFSNETPLEEVIKYIKTATANDIMPQGIPIYIDPVGLQEAEKTMQSPITLNLDGVTLKRSLKLLLKQLDLTYTVKEGLMTITYVKSGDQQTEIRVYPVADLAIIPLSLLGAGGGGGMGRRGMGGGGGGMNGGGNFGGGNGGGIGGGGRGFRSIAIFPANR